MPKFLVFLAKHFDFTHRKNSSMAQTATKITVVTAALIAITLIDINPPIEEGPPEGSPV